MTPNSSIVDINQHTFNSLRQDISEISITVGAKTPGMKQRPTTSSGLYTTPTPGRRLKAPSKLTSAGRVRKNDMGALNQSVLGIIAVEASSDFRGKSSSNNNNSRAKMLRSATVARRNNSSIAKSLIETEPTNVVLT